MTVTHDSGHLPDRNLISATLADREREVWPDILRITAIFAVIVLHSAAAGFYDTFPADTSQFQACNFYNAIVRFAVPVFVMISGMFLLDERRDYSIKKLFGTKILRIGTAYLLWAAFYSVVDQYQRYNEVQMCRLFDGIVYGHFHLWFCFMISGLYIATPILRWISKNEKICIYFMAVSLVIVFVCNLLLLVPKIGEILVYTSKRLKLEIVAGFSTYFLAGHYLATHKITSRKLRIYIYTAGIISVLGTIIFNGAYSAYQDLVKAWVFNNLGVNVFIIAVSVFVFFQSFFSSVKVSEKMRKLISLIAKLTFGIYLVHVFFLEHLHLIGLPPFFIHPLFSVPITSIISFIFSFCVAYILSKIPILKKYAI